MYQLISCTRNKKKEDTKEYKSKMIGKNCKESKLENCKVIS